eukprot:gene588-637_t
MVLSSFAALIPPDCVVVRDGKPTKISASELVVGDIVNLETGLRVPSDMRILSCSNLKIDKSMLTGESEPVRLTDEKVDAAVSMLEAPNMAFMGCNVVEGEGVGIVLATGPKNQLSKIAAQVTGVKTVPTSLQSDINRFVIIIGTIAFTTTVVVVLEWAFYLRVQHSSFMNPSQMIANAISVLVAYVPEGLPLALSMGLTIIATRLCVTHHVLLKKLSTVETLGSMSMLASDKTGTLTQNLMTVTGMISHEKVFSDKDIANAPTPIRHAVLRLSTLCNQAQLEQLPGASARVAVGSNGIDKALLQFAESENAVEICKLSYRVKVMMPFNSATKLTATVVNGPYTTVLEKPNANTVTTDSHRADFVLVKGAPEYILGRCSSVMGDSGVSTPLTPSVLAEIKRNLEQVSCTGRRVIALAQSPELVP